MGVAFTGPRRTTGSVYERVELTALLKEADFVLAGANEEAENLITAGAAKSPVGSMNAERDPPRVAGR